MAGKELEEQQRRQGHDLACGDLEKNLKVDRWEQGQAVVYHSSLGRWERSSG